MKRKRRVRAIPYYRVSTERQGRSGLGLEAQRSAVAAWAKTADAVVVNEPVYTETESGRMDDRPKLAEAIRHAKAIRGVVVVAKLDRLSRDVHLITGLMKSGVDFVCSDMPHADKTQLQMVAVFAELEARLISERTKAALAARKARGLPMGTPGNLTPEARAKGCIAAAEARRRLARQANEYVLSVIRPMRAEGATLAHIAAHLNEQGIPTRRGRTWHPMSVKILLDRQ
jgi:DNA invertase Pin-like site-specific DNA recombinase